MSERAGVSIMTLFVEAYWLARGPLDEQPPGRFGEAEKARIAAAEAYDFLRARLPPEKQRALERDGRDAAIDMLVKRVSAS